MAEWALFITIPPAANVIKGDFKRAAGGSEPV
jgi:hypothetical protein